MSVSKYHQVFVMGAVACCLLNSIYELPPLNLEEHAPCMSISHKDYVGHFDNGCVAVISSSGSFDGVIVVLFCTQANQNKAKADFYQVLQDNGKTIVFALVCGKAICSAGHFHIETVTRT